MFDIDDFVADNEALEKKLERHIEDYAPGLAHWDLTIHQMDRENPNTVATIARTLRVAVGYVRQRLSLLTAVILLDELRGNDYDS